MMFKKPNCSEREDIKKERECASFQVEELINILDGSQDLTKRRRKLEKLILEDPEFQIDFNPHLLSYQETYEKATERCLRLFKKLPEISQALNLNPKTLEAYNLSHFLVVPYGGPMFLHTEAFIPCILGQGSEEQKEKWLPLAREFKIIGAYAQTELGHGSFIRGLETTATYDSSTQEFVLNSPTVTSMKFWPGNMARTSNYAVVIAQLYTKGECKGIHSFIVQLRSLKDHTPMPGVELGDIGPRMDMNGMDNGFLILKGVRIPREQMLMGGAKVLPNGTYVPSENPYTTYMTMVLIRLGIISSSPKMLAVAATVAIRYSAIRRQGNIDSKQEVKILDYRIQQYRLLPQIATCYGFVFTYKHMKEKFLEVLAHPNINILPEVHALTCGLKAISTQMSATGCEQCRLACGGLGYLQASRLPFMYNSVTASCTYEGDNFVLLLQTARFLMKAVQLVQNGDELSPSVEFLAHDMRVTSNNQVEKLLSLYQRTTKGIIFKTASKLQSQLKTGKNADVARNELAVDLVRCSVLYCQTYVMSALWTQLRTVDMSHSLKIVLGDLFELLGIYWIYQNSGPFLQYGNVTSDQMDLMNDRLSELLAKLRPQAVPLVDSFDICDGQLLSVLGNYDGQVYEHIYHYLHQLPTNKVKVPEFYNKTLGPFLKSRL